MNRYEEVTQALRMLYQQSAEGVTAEEIADELQIDRSNVSRILNQLYKEGKCRKKKSRPVLFYPIASKLSTADTMSGKREVSAIDVSRFQRFSESNPSLFQQIEQGKAAILYPPHGMHTLLLGKTGVGKSMFAKLLYEYGVDAGKFAPSAPFVSFNCADYASNPQLLLGTLFGVAKGAYTGAVQEKVGLLEQADGGILFLDEIHRLPPEGQEMLFSFIDRGAFNALGESEKEKRASVMLIGATTEQRDVLLDTMIRRIPMVIRLPDLSERTVEERLQLFDQFVSAEVNKLNAPVKISVNTIKAFLSYDCVGNIGQYQTDIRVVLAKNYAELLTGRKEEMVVTTSDLPEHIKGGLLLDTSHRKMWQLLDEINTRFYSYYPQEACSPAIQQSIYAELEKRFHELEEKNLSVEDIQREMEIDWQMYFEQYSQYKESEALLSFIPEDLLHSIQKMVAYSEEKLKKSLSNKVKQALTIHVYNMVERIRNRRELNHTSTAKGFNVKKEFPELWDVAADTRDMLAKELNLTIPDQELEYFAIFFSYDTLSQPASASNVRVIVIAHGTNTATALSNTANDLLRDKCTVAIDAQLDQTPQEVLDELKAYIRRTNVTQDVLLLVDMGSLTNFSEEIEKEFGIRSKSIPLVSTMHVLEAGRKAMLNYSLDEVYHDTLAVNDYAGMVIEANKLQPKTLVQRPPLAILSICLTGEGTALTIQKILDNELSLAEKDIAVIPLNIVGQDTMAYRINELSKQYRIICLISSFAIQTTIPQFDLYHVMHEDGLQAIEKCVNEELTYRQMASTVKKYYDIPDTDDLVNGIYVFNEEVGQLLNRHFTSSDLIGLSFHIIGMVLKDRKGDPIPDFKDSSGVIETNPEFVNRIHHLFRKLFAGYFHTLTDDMMNYVAFAYMNKHVYQ